MARIFISYRREDSSGYTGRLADDLREHFGREQVFMDLEAIEPGADFVDALDAAVDSCAALLVVIGRSWLTISDAEGNLRLGEENDFVRIEVAAALERNARVIPVLVNGAVMPSAEGLPPSLTRLARRQAQELGDGKRWATDVAELIRTLERIPGLERSDKPATSAHEILRREREPERPPRREPERKPKLGMPARIALGVVGLLVLIGLFAGDDESDEMPIMPPAAIGGYVPGAIDPAVGGSQGFSSELQRVQGMLAQLGYDPGPIDGLSGPGTVQAIRDFQDGNGYPVNGRVTPLLLGQLEQEVQDESAWAQPAPLQPAANISGTWYDDQGNPLEIQQSGASVQIFAINPLLGTPYPIASGRFQGGAIVLQYRNATGESGSVRGSLAADGRHINGTDVDAATGYTVNATWHRGHLPGR